MGCECGCWGLWKYGGVVKAAHIQSEKFSAPKLTYLESMSAQYLYQDFVVKQ